MFNISNVVTGNAVVIFSTMSDDVSGNAVVAIVAILLSVAFILSGSTSSSLCLDWYIVATAMAPRIKGAVTNNFFFYRLWHVCSPGACLLLYLRSCFCIYCDNYLLVENRTLWTPWTHWRRNDLVW